MAAATPGRMGEPQGGVRSSSGRRSTPAGRVERRRGWSRRVGRVELQSRHNRRAHTQGAAQPAPGPTCAAELDGLQLGTVAAKAQHHHLRLGAVHIPLHALQAQRGGGAGRPAVCTSGSMRAEVRESLLAKPRHAACVPAATVHKLCAATKPAVTLRAPAAAAWCRGGGLGARGARSAAPGPPPSP